MKRLSQLLFAVVAITGLAAIVPPSSVGALGTTAVFSTCSTDPTASASTVCKSTGDRASSVVATVVNTLLYILGAIAVVVIIIAGISYTTSAGDASRVKKAKDTLLYAVVGLVVAMLAYAIVNFVITKIK